MPSMPGTCASAPALCCSAPALLAPARTLAAPSLSGTNAAWPSPALHQAHHLTLTLTLLLTLTPTLTLTLTLILTLTQGTAVDALQGGSLGACVGTPPPSPLRSWLNQAAHEVAMREVAAREFALAH